MGGTLTLLAVPNAPMRSQQLPATRPSLLPGCHIGPRAFERVGHALLPGLEPLREVLGLLTVLMTRRRTGIDLH